MFGALDAHSTYKLRSIPTFLVIATYCTKSHSDQDVIYGQPLPFFLQKDPRVLDMFSHGLLNPFIQRSYYIDTHRVLLEEIRYVHLQTVFRKVLDSLQSMTSEKCVENGCATRIASDLFCPQFYMIEASCAVYLKIIY